MSDLKKEKKWLFIIIGGIIFAGLKNIFTDFDMDCEYAIAMSYRMARGDHMVAQMWEPHQTSAFLNAFFIKIYLLLTGTTTGIVVYLNTIGLLVKSGVAVVFYQTFKKCCNNVLLILICTFFMLVNAKNYLILDYSNMMIYFSVLLCCMLFACMQRRSEGKKALLFLTLSAVCFCMEVLSYPSSIILFPFILGLIYRYSETKWRDMTGFSAVCAVFGGCYLLFLVAQAGGWEHFLFCIRQILTGDHAHSLQKVSEKGMLYFEEILRVAVLAVILLIFTFLVGALFFRIGVIKGNRKRQYIKIFFLMAFVLYFAEAFMKFDTPALMLKYNYLHMAIYIPILLLAFCLVKYCSDEEKMMYRIGMEISVWSSIAVLLLTNWTFLTTMAYLILAVMMSILPIGKYLERAVSAEENRKAEGSPTLCNRAMIRCYGIIVVFLGVVFFRNFFIYSPVISVHVNVLEIRNVVKSGPAIGIFSDYIGPHTMNCNLEDWREYIRKGDRVLIVGNNTIGYLYEDTEIAIDSTICTPTYDEKLLRYWELNPWKKPNVVVVNCWFGELMVTDEWIVQWIEENFEEYVDGTYLRFYRSE